MKVYSNTFFHFGVGGNSRGWRDQLRRINSNGIGVMVKSADAYGPIHEAIEERRLSGAPNFGVFRFTTVGQDHEYDYDVPPYRDRFANDPEGGAEEFWQKNKQKIETTIPEFDKDHCWVELSNEVDKERCAWLGRFAIRASELALADGYKVCFFGWSSGEPNVEHWEEPEMLAFLRMASEHPDKIAVTLHEYSYTIDDIMHEFPYKIGRFQFLLDVCTRNRINWPTILITEWGWTLNNIPSRDKAMRDLREVSRIYARYPNIKGVALWYLGRGWEGIADKCQKLIVPTADFIIEGMEVDIVTPPDFSEPSDKYERIREQMWADAESRWAVELNKDAALQKGIWAKGEDWLPFSPEWYAFYEGLQYACQGVENLETGEVTVVYALVPNWDNVMWVNELQPRFGSQMIADANDRRFIQLNTDAALQKFIFAEGHWLPTTNEWHKMYEGTMYACQGSENLETGETDVACTVVPQWNDVMWLSDLGDDGGGVIDPPEPPPPDTIQVVQSHYFDLEEGDWYDHPQYPNQQIQNGWEMVTAEGENTVGDPQWDWMNPESRFMWGNMLPRHEWGKYYNGADHAGRPSTYKIFVTNRAWNITLHAPTISLPAGRYRLRFKYADDCFVAYDSSLPNPKVPPPDPLSFEVRLNIHNQWSDWHLSNFQQDNEVVFEHDLDMDVNGRYGIELRCRWPIANGGIFAKYIVLERIGDYNPPDDDDYGIPVLSMPLSGPYAYTSKFGVSRDYDGDGVLDDLHEGADFAPRSANSKAIAVNNGRVVKIKRVQEGSPYGNYIVLRHDDADRTYWTWYCHLASIGVSLNQQVAKRQPLGLVGSTGNSTGPHIHFNLQVDGLPPQQGYVIQGVIDPERRLDLSPVYIDEGGGNLPTDGDLLFGIHNTADPSVPESEFAMLRRIKPRLMKVLTTIDKNHLSRLRNEHPKAKFIIRPYVDFLERSQNPPVQRSITPEQFVQYTENDIQQCIDRLGTAVHSIEIHNEMNLWLEGLDFSGNKNWSNGVGAGQYVSRVSNLYRQRFNVPMMWGGLSPGPAIPDVRYDGLTFFREAKDAIMQLPYCGMHFYWAHNWPMETSLAELDQYLSVLRGWGYRGQVIITECSNNKGNVTDEQKGREYLRWAGELQKRSMVAGMNFYIASSIDPAFAYETMADKSGLIDVLASRSGWWPI